MTRASNYNSNRNCGLNMPDAMMVHTHPSMESRSLKRYSDDVRHLTANVVVIEYYESNEGILTADGTVRRLTLPSVAALIENIDFN